MTNSEVKKIGIMRKLDLDKHLTDFYVLIIEIVNSMPSTFVKNVEMAIKNSKIANRHSLIKR